MLVCAFIMHIIHLELQKIYNKPNICLQCIMNKDNVALKTKKIKKSPLSKTNYVFGTTMKYWELKFEVYFFTSLALNLKSITSLLSNFSIYYNSTMSFSILDYCHQNFLFCCYSTMLLVQVYPILSLVYHKVYHLSSVIKNISSLKMKLSKLN